MQLQLTKNTRENIGHSQPLQEMKVIKNHHMTICVKGVTGQTIGLMTAMPETKFAKPVKKLAITLVLARQGIGTQSLVQHKPTPVELTMR